MRLGQEHAEHGRLPRVITLAMAWCAGVALGLATGDMIVSLVLTAVITAGHGVSWRTRTWRSARWQLLLLLPISGVAVLLVPSLALAFHGDWLQPMRYLLVLQSLASFYLHSRASLYTAQVLSAIVLLVSSQLAFDSLFLVPFFAFFLLLLAFLASATAGDALRGAVGRAPWPRPAQQAAWGVAGLVLLSSAGLGIFLVLPWGSIVPPGGASSVLPLTGEVGQGSSDGGQAEPGGSALPLTGTGPSPGPEDGPLSDGEGGSSEEAGGETPSLPASPSAGPDPIMPARGSVGESGASEQTGGETPALPARPSAAGAGGAEEAGGAPAAPAGEAGAGASDAAPGADSDSVVMQVRSPVATYWRGRVYSAFDGERWLPDPGVAIERPIRAPSRKYTQTFFLRGPQETPLVGYSPLGWQAVGGRSDASSLGAGDVYRVTSERRDFRPARLSETSGRVVGRDPTAEVPSRVRELAAFITRGAATSLDRALAITRHLRSDYRHVPSGEPWEPTQTVEQFLFGGAGTGNAYDFAAAQTALAAAAGLEARMVTGYLPGELDPLSGTYVVRSSDAHAWTEVNFGGGAGWVPFDGNPRGDGQATAVSRGSAARAVAGLFELRLGDELRQVARQAVELAVGSGGMVLAALAVATVVGAGYAAYRYRRRRRVGWPRYTLLAGTERRQVVLAYGRLMRQLRRDVAPREAGETAGRYFARLAERFPGLREELAQVHALVNEAAYRPVPLDGSRADAIRERLRATGRRLHAQARG